MARLELSVILALSLLSGVSGYSFTICEHSSGKSFSCPGGYYIYITYAMYGRLSYSTCGNNGNTNCRSGSSMSQTQSRCHGKGSCYIEASNGIYGDPCHGVRKYLTVHYNCARNGNWGGWGGWGSCSRNCGGGSRSRSRSCNNPSPSGGGSSCSGSSSQSSSCNTHSCAVHGNWGSWGSYGSCTKSCGSGTKTRSRSCNNPAPSNGGNNCAGSGSSSTSCNTHNCPRHGNWGNWGSYGSCARSCGGGTKTRSRSCNNPSPAYGGNSCAGSGSSSTSCNTHACPIHGAWGSWGSYGSCTKSCGSGTKTKSRSCNNPAPKYGGNNCPGSSTYSTSCNTHHCPIHGAWGGWAAWGSCTVTCGGGTKGRTRSCNNPAPKYGGTSCPNSGSSSTSCNTHNCPIDGAWGSWAAWGSCTVTCGGGTKGRTRTCTNPAPQYGGASCPNSASSSTSCNTHHCPIDGAWGSWAAWGSCTVTCGGGTKGRTRTCTNPAPQYGGASCPNSASSSTSCNTHHCPIDGDWAGWAAWGSCTVTCGGGIKSRSRTCTNPAPQYGGAACTGFSGSSTTCNTHNCPIDGNWGSWAAWGSCSVTCGGGTQSRSRTCTNPAPQYGGAACVSSATSSQACNTQHCPIDGAWSGWGAWGSCTVTCGGGKQTKTRTCTNPAPQYGGASCGNVNSAEQDCNTQVCIIDGAWGQWGSWGSCTVTCGGGQHSRTRICDSPKPANGGKSCPGDSAVYDDCNTQSCPTVPAGTYQQLCPVGWFTCEKGGITCISDSFKCDCAKDCDDGSDETEGYASCSPQLALVCGSSADHPTITIWTMLLSLLLLLFLR